MSAYKLEQLEQMRELRRDIADVRQLVELTLKHLGAEADVYRAREILAAYRGTSVFELKCDSSAAYRLEERGWTTFELVAMQGRATVAAVHGVGRVAMRALDEALAERGIKWAAAPRDTRADRTLRAVS